MVWVMCIVRVMGRRAHVKMLMLGSSIAGRRITEVSSSCRRTRVCLMRGPVRVVMRVVVRKHSQRVIIRDHVLIQQPLLMMRKGRRVRVLLMLLVRATLVFPMLAGTTAARIHRAEITRRLEGK